MSARLMEARLLLVDGKREDALAKATAIVTEEPSAPEAASGLHAHRRRPGLLRQVRGRDQSLRGSDQAPAPAHRPAVGAGRGLLEGPQLRQGADVPAAGPGHPASESHGPVAQGAAVDRAAEDGGGESRARVPAEGLPERARGARARRRAAVLRASVRCGARVVHEGVAGRAEQHRGGQRPDHD